MKTDQMIINFLKPYTEVTANIRLVDNFKFSNFGKLPKLFNENIDKLILKLQSMFEAGLIKNEIKISYSPHAHKMIIYNIQLSNEVDNIKYISISAVIKRINETNDISSGTIFHLYATSEGKIVNISTMLKAYEILTEKDGDPIDYGSYLEDITYERPNSKNSLIT